MEQLAGKRALVTGASGGIGAAVARSLHGEGAQVALLSRRGTELGLDGAVGVECDVRDRASVTDATSRAVEALGGGLDVVVANAGVGAYGDFLDVSEQDTEAMIDTNLKGVIYTAAATLPHLESGGGDFVSVASVAGVNAFPGEAAYNASKFGQVGFVRSLDLEYREKGVRCSNICPGGVNTDFAMGTGREPGDPVVEAMMSPEDVAEFVLFALTRPRNLRLMTVTFRPMSEGSWG
jgi:NAD(P)-dependent dehydrogenase (short-subunit alcohol dehydrogenase family)